MGMYMKLAKTSFFAHTLSSHCLLRCHCMKRLIWICGTMSGEGEGVTRSKFRNLGMSIFIFISIIIACGLGCSVTTLLSLGHGGS